VSKEMRTSDWARALRVVLGLIAILAAVVVLSWPGLAVFTLLLILAFALIFLGVARIVHSVAAKSWSRGHRILHAAGGVLALVLGGVVLIFPALGASTLVFLLAFGLLCYGIVSLVIGGALKLLSKWTRALLVIVGVLSIVFSLIVFILPAFGLLTLVIWLSVSFLLNGIESVVSGIE